MATILNPKIKKVDADKIRPLRHLELRKGEDFSTHDLLSIFANGMKIVIFECPRMELKKFKTNRMK